MPREPGYGSKRSQDGEAQRTCRERRAGCPTRTSGDGAWAAPSGRDGQTQVDNLCYGGGTEAGQMRVDRSCICLAEQDWQDARRERPATGHGQPLAAAPREGIPTAYAVGLPDFAADGW